MSGTYPPPPLPSYGGTGNYPAQPDRGPRPPTVEWASRLMTVVAVVNLVGVIVSISTIGQLRTRIRADNPSADGKRVDHLVNIALVVGLVFGIAILVLYGFLIVLVRRGRNWARIVTWVVAGLGVLGLLSALAGSETPASRALGVASGLLDVAIVVLLALRASNDWFAGRRRS